MRDTRPRRTGGKPSAADSPRTSRQRKPVGRPGAAAPTSARAGRRSAEPLKRDGDKADFSGQPPLVSVIIPVMNERHTIGRVLEQAARIHPRTELIVVANGSRDGSAEVAARRGARVIRYPNALGHDVGRSVGARAARGEVLLFIDGDMVLDAKKLLPFVEAILGGADVALNNYSGPVHTSQVHPVVLAKHALNQMLGRPDLKGTSLTAIPHAISRKALAVIGAESLAVPPLAHAKAVAAGLSIALPLRVDVGRRNRRRRERERVKPLYRLITGDHLEAAGWLAMYKDGLLSGESSTNLAAASGLKSPYEQVENEEAQSSEAFS